jgi:hypothetical protein
VLALLELVSQEKKLSNLIINKKRGRSFKKNTRGFGQAKIYNS